MERRAGSLKFWAVTILLVIVTAFCCAGTVMRRTDFSARELEHFDRERLTKELQEITCADHDCVFFIRL